MLSLPHETATVDFASATQEAAFRYGPLPMLMGGGWGSGKTFIGCMKGLWLSDTFPKNRGLIFRKVGKELRATTMATFFKLCPEAAYRDGKRNDQDGLLKLNNGSEILFLHLENPDIQGIIRGLEINWFFGDQAEENPQEMEEIFDLLLGRLSRWDQAEVPAWMIAAHTAQTGRPWDYRAPVSGKPLPPPYAMLASNPDTELHWLYRRFHPESVDWQTTYRARGYRLFHMPSMENRFLSDANKQALLEHDEAFVRRNVRGEWGYAEGTIHAIPAESLLDGSYELLEYLRQHGTLHRVLDHGESSPTACGWFAVDRDGNVFCVAPQTKILTADLQWREAGSVQVGQALVGFDESAAFPERRHWRRSIVQAVETITQPSYRLTLSDGTTVICSAGHQWLVKKNDAASIWRRTSRLKIGQRLIKPLDVWTTDRSYGAGYLAGAYDGEGSYTLTNQRTPRLSFTQNPNIVLAQVQAELLARGFPHSVFAYQDRAAAVLIDRKHDVLRFLGSIRPTRLLPKVDVDQFGGFRGVTFPTVVALEPVGSCDVMAIETSTGTYLAEGLASHNCYREYYLPNALISTHRANITALSEYERYEFNLADPSIFHKTSQKHGGRWSVSDEYVDQREHPASTALYWSPADNNELGTRNRINEYLRVDPERIHPITKRRGSPRLFFLRATAAYPQGCQHMITQTRSQRRVKVGTDLGKSVFSDERDDTVTDHAYDLVRYMISARPPLFVTPGQAADPKTFFGARQRLAARQARLGVGVR